jgi:hypothetical protein
MEYLIIDPSTRKITIPKSEQLFGVYGEGNIERKYFKCPKIVGDNVDLSDCYIFVNYYTAKGLPGKYTAKDVKVDGENITFSWELKQHIFDANEDTSIYFAVEAKNKDKVEVFRTRPATGKAKETIDTDKEIEETHADVILDLISRVDTLEKKPISEEQIEKSVKSYLEKNPIEETDPTVPEWAKEEEKPTYTAEEVGALPSTTVIPSKLSELTADDEHETVTKEEKQAWNAKSDFSGEYRDLTGKPTIPTVPTKLPNPQTLTITYGGKNHTYDGSEAIAITIETGSIERIEKLATDTTVTLEPNKLYVFPEMKSLTYTIGEGTGEVHFIFKSGATATRVVHPSNVNIGSFSVESNKVYEVSILEGLLTSQNWSVS